MIGLVEAGKLPQSLGPEVGVVNSTASCIRVEDIGP